MYLKSIIYIIVLLFFNSYAFADQASHKAAVEELLLLSNQDKMMDMVWPKVVGMLDAQFQSMGAPEKLKPVFKKYNDRMFRAMERELSFENMKDDLMALYLNNYTEEEAIAIIKFYKSPAGKVFLAKMPVLMKQTSVITQKRMPRMMVEIRSISKEMVRELKDYEENHQG